MRLSYLREKGINVFKHLGTNKHVSKTAGPEKSQTNPREIPEKSPQTYTCELCDYQSVVKKDYTKHLESKKHMEKESSANYEEATGNTVTKYTCELCNKSYHAHSGLWKHKKTCVAKADDDSEEDESDEDESDDDESDEEEEDDDEPKDKLKEKLKEELKNELKEELKNELKRKRSKKWH